MQKIQLILEFISQYEQLLFLVYLLLSFIAAIIIDKIFILGIKRIVGSYNKGIKALINVSNLDLKTLTVGKLSYWFIPKINAAGRLGDASRAVKLFTTSNLQLANEIALDLENENEKRKTITLQHENDAISMINNSIDLKDQKIIILYNKDWHFGIIGIVASRIKEMYNRNIIDIF